MWFDNARTVGDVVTWYFTPPGAKFLPVENRFSSETWDTVHFWGEGAGEAWDHVPTYSKGSPPGPFTGQGGVCGKMSWFTDGAPSDAPALPRNNAGLPACCFPGTVVGGYDRGYSSGWNVIRVIP